MEKKLIIVPELYNLIVLGAEVLKLMAQNSKFRATLEYDTELDKYVFIVNNIDCEIKQVKSCFDNKANTLEVLKGAYLNYVLDCIKCAEPTADTLVTITDAIRNISRFK